MIVAELLIVEVLLDRGESFDSGSLPIEAVTIGGRDEYFPFYFGLVLWWVVVIESIPECI